MLGVVSFKENAYVTVGITVIIVIIVTRSFQGKSIDNAMFSCLKL